ncbi:MAG TPA: class I SAM-dependent methyltransferase [Candidatus Binataceae bacterium]|jgi:SAM-dependent methyltransferase|nr:class I SAM-dependent methyltransferase [Candidatus Binataceae bacterium]
MDPRLYPQMAKVEDTHWWFAARRAICSALLDRLALPVPADILEPGCGTGGNLAMLQRRGAVFALDCDESALQYAAARGGAILAQGSLPDQIPFANKLFDLAVMTDVIEHLDCPLEALRAVRNRLKPGGWILLTVPALPWLWSDHDVTHHHRRRYYAGELRRLLLNAGFRITLLSYYNCLLFFPIAAVRLLTRILRGADHGDGRHDLNVLPAPINRALARVFAAERHLIGRVPLPFGVSLIALGQA